MNRSLDLAFIDFQKAFDAIVLDSVLEALQECQVDYSYSRLIHNINKKATMAKKLHKTPNH